MRIHFDPRIPVFWLASLLLFFLTLMVNSKLTPFSFYIFLIGPMLILPALHLKSTHLIQFSLLLGISIDATLPHPYWIFSYGLPIICLAIRSIKGHFRVEDSYRFILLAHFSNFACIVLLVAGQCFYLGLLGNSIAQVLALFALSHLMLILVAPWFFSFERLLLQLMNVEPAYEDRFLES